MQSFGADGDSLLTALSLPYSKARTDQIDAVLGDLDAGKQGRIQSLIEELEGHAEEIGEFRKDLPKKYEELVAAQENAAREQYANSLKQLETEFLKISEQIPDSIITMREVPEDVPGGTEWNKEITEARSNALRVLKPDGADFNESVQVALKGARYDTLEKRYLALHADHVALKKQMSQYDESAPDFKGIPKPTPKASDKKPGVTYRETLNAIKQGQMVDV
jgi:DNA repair exonuclease SbcCD ATPase subunit